MSGRSRYHRWRWLAVPIGFAVLSLGCGSASAGDDPLAGARIVPPEPDQAETSQSSVVIELLEASESEEGVPAVVDATPTTADDQPSSATPTTLGDEASTSTDSAAETATTTPTGGRVPSAYSIVAQATVPTMVARSSPSADSETIAEFVHPTNSGSPLVFRAVDGPINSSEWIEVHLPIQPNGSTGWVRRQDVELSNNPYRLEIERSSYSLRVFYRNELWLDTTVAIGTGATPTPVGEFYLLELLRPVKENSPYGPFAFGLSGFSEVLESFGGADTAIIGIHGTNDPSSIGTEVSHGCVRLENAVIEQLAAVLPLGTPVRIT